MGVLTHSPPVSCSLSFGVSVVTGQLELEAAAWSSSTRRTFWIPNSSFSPDGSHSHEKPGPENAQQKPHKEPENQNSCEDAMKGEAPWGPGGKGSVCKE